MPVRDIVVHLDKTAASARRLDAAVAIAQRFGARLKGVFALSNPDGSNLASALRPRITESATAPAEALFRERTAAAGLAAIWVAAQREGGERNVVHALVRAVRTADFAVLGQFEAEAAAGTVPSDLIEHVVYIAGRPILVVPYAGAFTTIGRRVVVAWNNSREAARALADAMAFLSGADHVSVLVLAPQGRSNANETPLAPAVLDHLAQHGIQATTDRLSFDARGIDPAERLLSHLADVGADLLVMGATGQSLRHSPRQSLTPGVLAHMTVPVLLSS